MPLGLPALQAPALDSAGRFTQPWIGFFTRLTSAAKPIGSVVVGASPFAFVASDNGTLVLSGGSAVSTKLSRGRVTVVLDASVRAIPVAEGDTVTITYSAAPLASFVPRGA